MINMRTFLVAVAACTAMVTSACNPAAQRGEEPQASQSGAAFTKEVSGTLKISGFNPSDEVGQSRETYAKQQLAGVTVELDTTSFDPQKFAAQAASGNVPDLLQMDRSVVATLADKELIVPLDECYHGARRDAGPAVLPVDHRRRHVRRQGVRRAAVLPAPRADGEQASAGQGRRLAGSAGHLQARPDRRGRGEAAAAEGWQPVGGRLRPRPARARRTCGSRSSAAAPTTRPASPRWTTRTTPRR